MSKKKLNNKDKFIELIKKHGDDIWKPKHKLKMDKLDTNSHFDILKYKINDDNNIKLKPNFKLQFPDKVYQAH